MKTYFFSCRVCFLSGCFQLAAGTSLFDRFILRNHGKTAPSVKMYFYSVRIPLFAHELRLSWLLILQSPIFECRLVASFVTPRPRWDTCLKLVVLRNLVFPAHSEPSFQDSFDCLDHTWQPGHSCMYPFDGTQNSLVGNLRCRACDTSTPIRCKVTM